jgi:small subunit ribosomal protein S17
MAETPETPETEETSDPTPDEAAGAAAPEEEGAEAGAPAAGPSRREQRAAARQREASQRPPRTPEERQAERDELRRQKAAARRRRRLQEREKARGSRTAAEPTPAREKPTGRPKVRQGIVVSDKADKTITVRIDVTRRHRRYEKIVRSSTTLHAHDENNDAHTGDTVRVIESRPLSRTKRWRLDEILERAR